MNSVQTNKISNEGMRKSYVPKTMTDFYQVMRNETRVTIQDRSLSRDSSTFSQSSQYQSKRLRQMKNKVQASKENIKNGIPTPIDQ